MVAAFTDGKLDGRTRRVSVLGMRRDALDALLAGAALRRRRQFLGLRHTREFMTRLFGNDLHAKRVLSLANGVAGVLQAAVLSVHAIGTAYAKLNRSQPKHGIKQVDRMLSNENLFVEELTRLWCQFVVGDARDKIVIALDWTDFDDDDHTTLCAYLVTDHGRATPLAWKTIAKSELKGRRTATEHEMVDRLHDWLPKETDVILLADRGFGDQKLYEALEFLGWDYVIRFRGNILVESQEGVAKRADEWVPPNGRARKLDGARVTQDRALIPSVVVVKKAKMQEAWCLATSLVEEAASDIVSLYGRRFSIEETFRDTKDLHFGMGLRATHIGDADRRDRLLLLAAMAHALLTLLGAASEKTGLDRKLRANTVKRRTHSLFRQGLYWYDCIPTMREDWLRPLMEAFNTIVAQHAVFRAAFGVI
jgi:hypothetical protein